MGEIGIPRREFLYDIRIWEVRRIIRGYRRRDLLKHQLMLQTVTATIATDDAANLPEAEVVEELTAGDAYLAHEQLVDVVGGG